METLKVLRIRTEDGENVHYPILYDGVPDHFRNYAREELNETDENIAHGLQRLRDYMKKENLSCSDDNYLLALLRCSKFNPAKSETKLRKALKARKTIASQLAKLDSAKMASIVDDMAFSFLPYRDSRGRIVAYVRPSMNLDKYTSDEVFYCGFASLLFMLSCPLTAINGWVMIANCKSPSLFIFYPIIMSFKKIIPGAGNLALRFGRMDIMNENFLVHWGLCIAKAFLPEKLYSRLAVLGHDTKKLHELYHPDILPSDVGGSLGPLTNKHYREKLLAFLENLRNERT